MYSRREQLEQECLIFTRTNKKGKVNFERRREEEIPLDFPWPDKTQSTLQRHSHLQARKIIHPLNNNRKEACPQQRWRPLKEGSYQPQLTVIVFDPVTKLFEDYFNCFVYPE